MSNRSSRIHNNHVSSIFWPLLLSLCLFFLQVDMIETSAAPPATRSGIKLSHMTGSPCSSSCENNLPSLVSDPRRGGLAWVRGHRTASQPQLCRRHRRLSWKQRDKSSVFFQVGGAVTSSRRVNATVAARDGEDLQTGGVKRYVAAIQSAALSKYQLGEGAQTSGSPSLPPPPPPLDK